jgi:DNA polymerase III epsilon subunit-like protein
MNYNKICVFDFETDGRDPTKANPVQLAAVIVDPRKLEIVNNAEFNSFMRPEGIDEEDYFENNRATIERHSNIRDCTPEEIIELWKKAPSQKMVWENFVGFLEKFHKSGKNKTKFSAPLACGYNILAFDLHIVNRMCENHLKGKQIFHPRDKLDLMHWMFPWFENSRAVTSFSMDNMREYLGMSTANAHDAMKDVKDTAGLLCRFLRLYRRTARNVKFKGSFVGEE